MSLRINSDFNGVTDPDAGAYIAAVEAADGNQLLEFAVGKAINDFVVGCKADGIWNAIKASCILAGARTLSGALVPLAGSAPTNINNNFVDSDYNRKTGLKGNGINDSTGKRLNTNFAENAVPQNSIHASIYISQQASALKYHLFGTDNQNATGIWNSGGTATQLFSRNAQQTHSINNPTGFIGSSRFASNQTAARGNSADQTISTLSSAGVNTGTFYVFSPSTVNQLSDGRLAFYSIGEALDLAKLDARVTALINAFGAAIP